VTKESLPDGSEVELAEQGDCHGFDVVACLVCSEDHRTWRTVVGETGSEMMGRSVVKEVREVRMASWQLLDVVSASCFSTFDCVLEMKWP